MDMIGLYLENVLRPVFEDSESSGRVKTTHKQDGDILEDDNNDRSSRVSNRSQQSTNKATHVKPEDILDLDGPKLLHGCRPWIMFYQIIGQLNWLEKPLFLSILYKFALISLITYVIYYKLVTKLFQSTIGDMNYRNPIFIFISLLAITSTTFNTILSIRSHLFNLCPLFKVLTTPKLCFISVKTQNIVGGKTLSTVLVFLIYHTMLLQLFVHKNFASFSDQFDPSEFAIILFSTICAIYHLIGLSHLDFYIRVCFASWLLALKANLEFRFAHLHRHQRLQRLRLHHSREWTDGIERTRKSTDTYGDGEAMDHHGTKVSGHDGSGDDGDEVISSGGSMHDYKEKYNIVTLDEIQKNLNTMDDHLEVLRSIQTSSLVLITLNAFLTNGSLLLLAYNLLANRGDYYHGLILILIVMNYSLIIFISYIGDSWLYYALSSFVQTVEDEYFLQGGDGSSQKETFSSSSSGGQHRSSNSDGIVLGNDDNEAEMIDLMRKHQILLIKKKDVLFCREFLHQFENHLATPWSKLNVKVHLRMLGTFVTLIAAQIIFDHEH